jgi:hypothetical protein
MSNLRKMLSILWVLWIAHALCAQSVAASEEFGAIATMKTDGGGSARTPMIFTVDRTMSETEANRLAAAFRANGAAGLREALEGVPPTGVVRLGATTASSRLTIEHVTSKGRLLTIITERPLAFSGPPLPSAGVDEDLAFGVIDIEMNSQGVGSGTLAPTAKITLKGNRFVVEDHAAEIMRLSDVTRMR